MKMRTRTRWLRAGTLAALVAGVFVLGSGPLGAQERRFPLQPAAPEDRPVVPFMEGWYDNGDGSVTISFGYFNLNHDSIVEIPLGEANRIEPGPYQGLQPTVFFPGRNHGAFGITVPADMRGQDVWWSLINADGDTAKVPGRSDTEAYQLDRNPRPHGSLPPRIWFEDETRPATDPSGVVAEQPLTTAVGQPVTLEAHVTDVSERDPEDPRIRVGVPVHVTWVRHQGPAEVTYARHESTPEDQSGEGAGGLGVQMVPLPPGPNQILLPEGQGTVRVNATFSEPGDYVMRIRADNFGAPDSNPLDQCCWSNGYVRVHVTP
jgi:hypothetical protein